MKIFNLTDIETPALRERGLVNRVLVAGRAIVEPGASVEIGDDSIIRQHLLDYTSCGAMAVDVLPPYYASAKAEKERAVALEKKLVDGRAIKAARGAK